MSKELIIYFRIREQIKLILLIKKLIKRIVIILYHNQNTINYLWYMSLKYCSI